MPGIFGAISRVPDHHPLAVAETMQKYLTHQPWYSRVLESDAQGVLGAVSTNPFFQRNNHLARGPESWLLVEGTALVLDGRPLADDNADLAERLLAAFLESGLDFVHRLGGHFNLVIRDLRDGRCHLINDRLGFAHMYWYVDDEVFLFGPELKVFLAWKNLDTTLNEASFGSLLAKECPYGTETLFAAVQMLAPATCLSFGPGGVQQERYWRPEPQPENHSTEEWLQEAEHLYRRSLAKRLPRSWTDRVVLPLSGGLDSRLLLWLARDHGPALELFTHGQDDCTDAVLARQTAAALDLGPRHHLVAMNPDWAGIHGRQAVWLNDGQLNLRNATLVGISEELGPGPVPFLNGIIGAHMSLGVGNFVSPDEMVHLDHEDELRRRVLACSGVKSGAVFLEDMMAPELAGKLQEAAEAQVWRSFQDYRHVELFGDQKTLFINGNPGRRMQGTVDVHRFFFHDLLPFVDEELHDLWLRIPLQQRLDNHLYKEMYRRRIPVLAKVPWANTGLDLFASKAENDAALAGRMKRLRRREILKKYSFGLINLRNRDAYTHRQTWLRRNVEFRGLMKGVLRDVGATGCPWFDQKKIDLLFRRFDKGRDYLFRPLMQVATVVIWHGLFMQGDRPRAGLLPGQPKNRNK